MNLMSENEELAKLVDGAYKNILEKFNPCARQLISAGKAYLKALHGEMAASKAYIDSLGKLARHAHQGTWGGCTDIDEIWKVRPMNSNAESRNRNICTYWDKGTSL
ncbi:brain-specific angiogenesis inhibitor 1-associated protein 2 [Caerostris darwini]|uniref:Brain-specific angiogenesis inhibitor 1-associated protein 2 n=1 Tax=Caerostris darwini TaxID=1538125 RepID=A0AAV4UGA3_9ARAC|nr:brain-specific angiogenesis inhibitor 1-associated protein 2 [Caerostris darwini]